MKSDAFRQRKLAWLFLIPAVLILGVVVMNMFGRPDVGLDNGRLKPCPDSPNCVCSQDSGAGHQIDPIQFEGSAEDAMRKLEQIIEGQPRTCIVDQRADYVHATFTTAWFRFVDDVEFLLDASQKRIHVRSRSRVGYSDLGVNRRRIESLREAFNR